MFQWEARSARNMKTTRIRIKGMKCASCAANVEAALKRVPGVGTVAVKLDQDAVVEHHGVEEKQLLKAITGAGRYEGTIL